MYSKHELVPLINQLENATVFVPVNLAFTGDVKEDKDLLLRYIVNQRFRVGYMDRRAIMLETLYRPGGNYGIGHGNGSGNYTIKISPNFETLEYEVDDTAAIVEVDIFAKHQRSFVEGILELMPLKPSVCDLLMNSTNDDLELNGFKVSTIRHWMTSLFLGNDDKNDVDGALLKKKRNNNKKERKDLPSTCEEFFNNTRTVFIPTDSYLHESMSSLEYRYYSTLFHVVRNEKFSKKSSAIHELKFDLIRLLSCIMLPELIGGANITNGKQYPLKDGGSNYTLAYNNASNTITVNGKIQSASLAGSNIVLSDVVVHLFDSQLEPFWSSLNVTLAPMIMRKALYALHFSNFASEVEFRSLEALIDGRTSGQTLFVGIDSRDDAENDDNYYYTDSFSNKQTLLYRFLDQFIDLREEMGEHSPVYKLLNSKLSSKKRINGNYQIKLASSWENNNMISTVNDETLIIDEPILTANNNIIYVTKNEIFPPLSLKLVLGGMLSSGVIPRHLNRLQINKKSCLATVEYLNRFDLISEVEELNGYTAFLPCGGGGHVITSDPIGSIHSGGGGGGDVNPWKALGLVLNHLEANPKLFESILKGFFVKGMIYSDFGLEHDEKYTKNLRGDLVKVSDTKIEEDGYHQILVNSTLMKLPLNSEILFSHGLVHTVDKIILPNNFQISIGDLLKTTEDKDSARFNFTELLEYDQVLKAVDIGNFSLLVPTSESLKKQNITTSYEKLNKFLQLHLIPNDQLGSLLHCMSGSGRTDVDDADDSHIEQEDTMISTNYTRAILRCKRTKRGKTTLRLFNSESEKSSGKHEVVISNYGCSSTKSCVFLIEDSLRLSWLDEPDDTFLHIHLGSVSVAIGIVIGLMLVGGFLFVIVACLGTPKLRKSSSGPLAPENIFERPQNNFMRVNFDNEEQGPLYDCGYETDIDIVREEDPLLKGRKKRFKRHRNYGAINDGNGNGNGTTVNGNGATSPRDIRKNNILSTLNRERNLPDAY
ncbi:uncharacterized protein KQ657_004233 [Scheffersomyces spartinae]|uniref:FAS1 domain-containing protein n=1 Tax=Scheffersomyces spartinae TaxID=45513 RepID=A0A9P7VAX1_9ASCO|nr:uncharacterized protein KQ657_004233 [Scheffersomyces spartinae]KAG7194562.1 hypothetical protein KQ657_004233 [Scheffersomyces spartinae]